MLVYLSVIYIEIELLTPTRIIKIFLSLQISLLKDMEKYPINYFLEDG